MIDYDVYGNTGEFLFFLHGWGGDKNSFKLVKNRFIKPVKEVYVSFSGFGKSKEPDKTFCLDDYVNELLEVIVTESKGKKITIICHSFGARVAVNLISKHPSLVKKLIIVDGAGIKPKRSLKYYFSIFKYKRVKAKVKKGILDKKELEKYGSSDYKKLSPIMKKTFVKIVNQHLKKEYRDIKIPTLLFWGKNDTETPLYMAKKINRWIACSELVVSKTSGHFSYLEDSEFFINTINSFIFS